MKDSSARAAAVASADGDLLGRAAHAMAMASYWLLLAAESPDVRKNAATAQAVRALADTSRASADVCDGIVSAAWRRRVDRQAERSGDAGTGPLSRQPDQWRQAWESRPDPSDKRAARHSRVSAP